MYSLTIIIIAIVAGFIGYKSYDMWTKRKSKVTKRKSKGRVIVVDRTDKVLDKSNR